MNVVESLYLCYKGLARTRSTFKHPKYQQPYHALVSKLTNEEVNGALLSVLVRVKSKTFFCVQLRIDDCDNHQRYYIGINRRYENICVAYIHVAPMPQPLAAYLWACRSQDQRPYPGSYTTSTTPSERSELPCVGSASSCVRTLRWSYSRRRWQSRQGLHKRRQWFAMGIKPRREQPYRVSQRRQIVNQRRAFSKENCLTSQKEQERNIARGEWRERSGRTEWARRSICRLDTWGSAVVKTRNEGVPVRYPGTARLVQRAHEHRSARCITILVRSLVIPPARTI